MAAEEQLPSWVDPENTVRLDAVSIRGLAHPTRLKILGLLRVEGPATATMLAEWLGMNTGATSYHLRQLEAYGFVVDVPERGSGRDRWWRAAHEMTYFDRDALADLDAGAEYHRWVAHSAAERIIVAADEFSDLAAEWRSAATMSDALLDITPDEARRLRDELWGVIDRYRKHDPEDVETPEGAAPVSVQIQAIPHPRTPRAPGG